MIKRRGRVLFQNKIFKKEICTFGASILRSVLFPVFAGLQLGGVGATILREKCFFTA
jgi:hypothetical protein